MRGWWAFFLLCSLAFTQEFLTAPCSAAPKACSCCCCGDKSNGCKGCAPEASSNGNSIPVKLPLQSGTAQPFALICPAAEPPVSIFSFPVPAAQVSRDPSAPARPPPRAALCIYLI